MKQRKISIFTLILFFLISKVSFGNMDPIIFQKLASKDELYQQEALHVLEKFIDEEKERGGRQHEDLIKPLIKQLNDPLCLLKIKIANLLLRIAQYDQRSKDLMREEHGLGIFVKWLKQKNGLMLKAALMACRNLSYNNPGNQDFFYQSDVLPVLVEFYREGSFYTRKMSLAALRNLSYQNEEIFTAILALGNFSPCYEALLNHHPSKNEKVMNPKIIPPLDELEQKRKEEELKSLPSFLSLFENFKRVFYMRGYHFQVQEFAVLDLLRLAKGQNKKNQEAIREAGILPHLDLLLWRKEQSKDFRRGRFHVIKAIYEIILDNPENKKSICNKSLIDILLSCLIKSKGDFESSQVVLSLLRIVVANDYERQKDFRDLGGFNVFISLLKNQKNEMFINSLLLGINYLLESSVKNRRSFHKSGGSKVLISFLKNPESQVWLQEKSLSLLSLLLERNLERQKYILENSFDEIVSFYEKASLSLKVSLEDALAPLGVEPFATEKKRKKGRRYVEF